MYRARQYYKWINEVKNLNLGVATLQSEPNFINWWTIFKSVCIFTTPLFDFMVEWASFINGLECSEGDHPTFTNIQTNQTQTLYNTTHGVAYLLLYIQILYEKCESRDILDLSGFSQTSSPRFIDIYRHSPRFIDIYRHSPRYIQA